MARMTPATPTTIPAIAASSSDSDCHPEVPKFQIQCQALPLPKKWTIAYNKSSKHMKALTTQSLLHLSVYSAAYKPPAYLLSGVTSTLRISFVRISLQMSSMNASKDCAPSSPLKRLRTDTTPSSSSFCPTTSIYGVF